MTFGEQVREARKRLALSQVELAARLGVQPQSVSNWECERSTPWPKEQGRVLEALNGKPKISGNPVPWVRRRLADHI